jgi:hypothetical protein
MDMYDERHFTRFDILRELRLFHRLPVIESLSVGGVCEDAKGLIVLPPHVSNLRRINITHSDISSMTLASVIRLSKALEEFKFSIGGRATVDVDGGFAMIYPKMPRKVLLRQKASLRRLDLDMDDYLHKRPGGGEQEDNGDKYDADGEEEELAWQRDMYFEFDEAVSNGRLWTRPTKFTWPDHWLTGRLWSFDASFY